MDTTQWTGILSFGLAAAACFVAGCRPWPLLALVNACFAVECALGWRHRFHNWAIAAMGDLYAARTPAQLVMMAVVVGVVALGLFQLRSGATARVNSAATITLLAAMLFLLETISLHGLDAILYRPAKGLLLIGWLWLLLGGATVASAFLAARAAGVSHK